MHVIESQHSSSFLACFIDLKPSVHMSKLRSGQGSQTHVGQQVPFVKRGDESFLHFNAVSHLIWAQSDLRVSVGWFVGWIERPLDGALILNLLVLLKIKQ